MFIQSENKENLCKLQSDLRENSLLYETFLLHEFAIFGEEFA